MRTVMQASGSNRVAFAMITANIRQVVARHLRKPMRKLSLLFILSLVFILGILPGNAQQAFEVPTEPVRWDGETRFNMLVMGMDRRPGARDNLNTRTDVIMIVSYDPQTQRLGILDIPRDMHVAVINVQDELLRINTLMVEGESLTEGYGPYFAIETLQLNFGMYIDAYVAFDFEAFIGFIDAIGGITLDVPYEIYDATYPDMNYGVDPFYINRGVQEVDGETALKYARTRHGDNDYVRGQRLLQVVTGVFERLSDPAALRELVLSVPDLLETFDSHVYTNIATEELVPLGVAMMQVERENVFVGSINQNYSFNYTYQNQTVRVPDRELLPQLLTDVFGEDYWR